MRVLLDECLPRRLKRELVGQDARTAPEMGWASKRNGELLALAAAAFDVFLTADRNLLPAGRFSLRHRSDCADGAEQQHRRTATSSATRP